MGYYNNGVHFVLGPIWERSLSTSVSVCMSRPHSTPNSVLLEVLRVLNIRQTVLVIILADNTDSWKCTENGATIDPISRRKGVETLCHHIVHQSLHLHAESLSDKESNKTSTRLLKCR